MAHLQRNDGADLCRVQALEHDELVHAVHKLRPEVLLHLRDDRNPV